jgi:hypothetical protein
MLRTPPLMFVRSLYHCFSLSALYWLDTVLLEKKPFIYMLFTSFYFELCFR